LTVTPADDEGEIIIDSAAPSAAPGCTGAGATAGEAGVGLNRPVAAAVVLLKPIGCSVEAQPSNSTELARSE